MLLILVSFFSIILVLVSIRILLSCIYTESLGFSGYMERLKQRAMASLRHTTYNNP